VKSDRYIDGHKDWYVDRQVATGSFVEHAILTNFKSISARGGKR
jgi:hypothetical protein